MRDYNRPDRERSERTERGKPPPQDKSWVSTTKYSKQWPDTISNREAHNMHRRAITALMIHVLCLWVVVITLAFFVILK